MRLCGTIKTSQKCLWHRSGITSLYYPLKVSMIIKGICPFGYLSLDSETCCNFFLNNSIDFFCIRSMVIRKSRIKISWKINFSEITVRFPFINELEWSNLSSHTDSKGCSGLSLIIYTFNRHFLSFGLKMYFPVETCDKNV